MKDILRITITPADCKDANFESTTDCPLIRAIKRMMFCTSVSARDSVVTIDLSNYVFDESQWNEGIMNRAKKEAVIVILTKKGSYASQRQNIVPVARYGRLGKPRVDNGGEEENLR